MKRIGIRALGLKLLPVTLGCLSTACSPSAIPTALPDPVVLVRSATPRPTELSATPRPTINVTLGPTPSDTASPTAGATHPPTPAPIPTPFAEYCGDYPCSEDIGGWLERMELPPGFVVSHRGQLPNEERPTSLTFGPNGRLFAASMEGNIYAFDSGGEAIVYAQGFHLPIGLVFQPGSSELYVAARSFPPEQQPNAGKVTIVRPDRTQLDIVIGLPCCYTADMHQPNSLAFGPDGKVYLSIGAMSDHLEPATDLEAAILRFDPDGGNLERFAGGLRNPYDLAFDADGHLFVTDNGPDYGGPELLYHVEKGAHFLFPHYPDCDFCPQPSASLNITEPIATFVPHGAIAGITVYTHTAFPEPYYNSLFIALWSAFPGAQKIVRVQTYPTQTADFMLGLAAPIDVIQTPSGGIAVADWATGHIFQVSYSSDAT